MSSAMTGNPKVRQALDSLSVARAGNRSRPPLRGQTMIIIALAALLIIAAIGLAVDGGAMFVERRQAQNSADAAALAAVRVMLSQYEDMINNYASDVDYGSTYDIAINNELIQYASAHSISRSDLEAFYVDDNKQIVNFNQVGSVGFVPWVEGAKGIYVKNRSSTNSFFMNLFGWDRVAASAASIAFMGVTTESNSMSVMPIGLDNSSLNVDNIQVGQMYTLLNGDVSEGSGPWAWMDFNGTADAGTKSAWIGCGYNPEVTTSTWPEWCTDPNNGGGPTQHFESANASPYNPSTTPSYVPWLVYGPGAEGWWLAGATSGENPTCQTFRARVGDEGDFVFPVFDQTLDYGGGNTRYHLRALVQFHITQADVQCLQSDPTPTPPPDVTPTPGPTPTDTWTVRGTAENFYDSNASGKHGDLRHSSGHTVFLDSN